MRTTEKPRRNGWFDNPTRLICPCTFLQLASSRCSAMIIRLYPLMGFSMQDHGAADSAGHSALPCKSFLKFPLIIYRKFLRLHLVIVIFPIGIDAGFYVIRLSPLPKNKKKHDD